MLHSTRSIGHKQQWAARWERTTCDSKDPEQALFTGIRLHLQVLTAEVLLEWSEEGRKASQTNEYERYADSPMDPKRGKQRLVIEVQGNVEGALISFKWLERCQQEDTSRKRIRWRNNFRQLVSPNWLLVITNWENRWGYSLNSASWGIVVVVEPCKLGNNEQCSSFRDV